MRHGVWASALLFLIAASWYSRRADNAGSCDHASALPRSALTAQTPSPALQQKAGKLRRAAGTPTVLARESSGKDAFIFEDTESRASMLAFINDLATYLDPEESRYLFGQSGLDTKPNMEAAARMAKQAYGEVLDRQTLQTRVLALRLLAYSTHYAAADCLALLRDYAATAAVGHRNAVLLDVLELGKICMRLDPEGLVRLREDIDDATVRAQVDMALHE